MALDNPRFPAEAFDTTASWPVTEVPTDVAAAPPIEMPQSVQSTIIGDNVNSPVAGYSERFGSPAPVIKAAVAQLNAGQPVTALPRISFSYDQQQAYVARLNEFDRQAKAARMAADQAARDAQLLDQMSRVAKSTKDIEVQRHMIDAMAGQQELAAGVPLYQVAARHPLMFGSGLSAALKTEPTPPAKWHGAAGGAPGYFETEGGHVVVPPATAFPQAPMATPKPQNVGNGVTVVQVSPNKFQVVDKSAPGKLNDVEKARISAIDAEMKATRDSIKNLTPTKPKYIAGTNQLAVLKAERDGILKGASTMSTNAPTTVAPAAAPTYTPSIRVRRKSDNKVFIYPGAAADVPTDQYDVLP